MGTTGLPWAWDRVGSEGGVVMMADE